MATTSTSFDPPVRRDPFSISTNHARSDANGQALDSELYTSPQVVRPHIPPAYDLPGISLRAFCLGFTVGLSTLFTMFFAYFNQPLWRLPFFLSTLSLFHSLEYQITAMYNPSFATVSAFLLSQNGRAYNIAHTLAFLECFVHYSFVPTYFPQARLEFDSPNILHLLWLVLGFGMLLVGQVTRTVAMAQAGSNFNHTVQRKKRQGHTLVTDGIYAWLRHPSYFGFFFWGLGTQVVLGNLVCLIGYAVVLWRFFRHRIRGMRLPLLSDSIRECSFRKSIRALVGQADMSMLQRKRSCWYPSSAMIM